MTNKFRKILSSTIAGSLLICSAIGSTMSVFAATASKYEYSVTDSTQLQKYLVRLGDLTDTQKVLYDIDKNGELTITDATNIQKIVVGLAPDIPSENPTSSTVESTTMTATKPTQATTTIEPTTEQPTTEPKPTSVPKSVKLNINDITFGIGEKYTLVTTVENGDISQVAFTTSDRKVATVDNNGKITAVGTGTATITANTYNGLKAKCKVTVKKLADSIKLDKTSITLGVGEQYDFSSSIPNGTAAYFRSYYSDNTAIATVQKSGGLMTAKTAGTTTIRCKLSSGKEATCKVTVKSAPSRVTVSDKSATLKVGQSKTLKATLNNNAYSYRSTWTSSNTYVATVNSTGKISAKSQGTATITYKTYNGKTASCKLTVSGSVAKCIDVSTWQGSIDFNKVKSAGYNYVIIRAGYGKEKSQKDNMFEINYKNAKAAGLKVGAYWFSYAMSPSTATAEADACLSCIKGKKFELPVYYDMEYQPAMSTSNSNYTKMAVNFCNKLKSNGFKSGVYSSASVYDYLLNRTTLKNNGISIWNAEWYIKPSISCDVWQYSDNGRINGISTNVDLNYIYDLNILN
jgi:GH25 family lysozyme M1 (1,4-beta-N-acetylmuramidase)